MTKLVTLRRDGGIGIITINNPPVNALTPELLAAMLACIQEAEAADDIRALVLIGNGRTFSAGGDLKLVGPLVLKGSTEGINFDPILRMLEDCRKPVVCAINGAALGGGFQIALACHYRIAVREAQVGEPEVKLGLIPNGGGTQRLPRLAGVAKAADMCARGEPLLAAEALACGILDRVVAADLLPAALDYARNLVLQGAKPRRTRECCEKLGTAADNVPVLEAARSQARSQMRGHLAPLKAIDAVEAATTLPFDEGCRRETQLFEECFASEQAKSLFHIFLSERAAGKIPENTGRAPAPQVSRAAVVGGGTMGCGIAIVFADAGISVLLKEVSWERLEESLATIRGHYERAAKSGYMSRRAAQAALASIHPTSTYDGFDDVDVVIEAVFEELELKKQIFSGLDRVCRPDAILASNTSALDIDEIAGVTSHPERVVAFHFFAPARVMRLLEIARGRSTSDDVIAASLALARKLGKVGVVVQNCRGFVGNRMYQRYQREAQLLLEEGASVPDVDSALSDFGMAMGPLVAADMSGLDVGWRIRRASPLLEGARRDRPVAADRLCELGRFGQKTGAGWYRYRPGDRKPLPDPEVERIIEACALEKGIVRRVPLAREIVERTIYALINEGARILEERVAAHAADIDVIYVDGYGFPAHRGGPMWFGDTVGLHRIYQRVGEFERMYGSRWAPASLLRKLAESGRRFADLDSQIASQMTGDAG
jgi:3-hydroxyacyl-CoA dehydrogenase